jgi:hypothetical protein
MNPCVVSSFQLAAILRHHPCFNDRTDIHDLSHIITERAMSLRWEDLLYYLRPCFREWRDVTPFHPTPDIPANASYLVSPVRECLVYRESLFYRDRYCIGVTFATFVPMNNREVGVVWTTTRRAYMFEYIYLTGWVVFKILNRQDDPFRTWLRHLGGDTLLVKRERDERSPERLFHDLVVPYFGTHPLARDVSRMRGIRDDDPVWELVKRVSNDIVSHTDPRRFVWVQ